MLQKVWFVFISSVAMCSAYKLLVVFPLPGKSHSMLGESFATTLLNAGHEVTYVTPFVKKNASANLQYIDVSSNFDVIPIGEILQIEKLLNKEIDLTEMFALHHLMYTVAKSTILHENVQEILHNPDVQFDAVIAEWMYSELYSGLASVLGCPLIWSSSMDPHYLVLALIDQPLNPTYTADALTNDIPPFSFSQRVSKLWSYFDTIYKKSQMRNLDLEAFEQAYKAAASKRGRTLPSFDEAVYNGSLMFGNSHVSAGQAIALPQNYIPIAGYHIDPEVNPLPTNLQKIMDSAKHGVIYFSMGSMLKSKEMPEEIKKGILQVFSSLKQTVIWKFEENLDRPENVHILDWVPQQSVLSHPNCVLFITHGGLLSTTETLHYGVPIIGIPIFADQFNNVNRAVVKGFAKRVDLDFDTPVNLNEAIQDILGNPRYRERVKELSFVYHHRPVPPRTEIVHWVEHVVRTRGAPHLRSPALLVSWYQKLYLDLIFLVLSTVILTILIAKGMLRRCKKNCENLKSNKKWN